MAVSDQSARLRAWNALALGLAVLYAAGLALFCYSALTTTPTPSKYAITLPPFSAYSDPRGWWPVALQLALGLGAFGAYYVPRRNETRSFSLLITGGLGVSTIVLGVCSVWNCTEQESPFFTPLAMALGLLIGSTPTFVGACATGQPYPLALQLARLLGPLLLVMTAVGIVATLFRAQVDRLAVRFAHSLVVVIGLSEDAIPVLRRLAHDLPRRTVLAVLVSYADHPLTKLTREIGARVVVCELDDPNALRVLVLRQGKFKVHALYLLSADVSANLTWARQLRDVATTAIAVGWNLPTRITARIDDPWQAEYWRRTNAYRTEIGSAGYSVPWVPDALSIYEVTAAILVAHVQSRPHERLALVGSSPLALAICAELAQRQRESALLGTDPRPSFGELILIGPDADRLLEQHRIRQEQFGNAAEIDRIAVKRVEPTEEALSEILEAYQTPAVVFADDLGGSRSDNLAPTLLAALNPDWTIYHSDATMKGLAPGPTIEELYPFGLTIEPADGVGLGAWERAAMMVHRSYLNTLGELDPTKIAQRPWAELPAFYRASNVRLVMATLAGAESVGRSWGPDVDPNVDASTSILPSQLVAMAQFEHGVWARFYRDQGWTYGATRNDARRVHNALVPWSELSPSYRDRAIGNVMAALATLHALGYRSLMVSDRPWFRAFRRGEVRAKVLELDWRWQTRTGEWLQARAGDYQVSNGNGEAWSVEPEIFTRSYEHVKGDRWRRTGEVWAQPAVPGELVISLEGPSTAGEGDWVIKGAAGEQWITSAEHFAANYQREPSG